MKKTAIAIIGALLMSCLTFAPVSAGFTVNGYVYDQFGNPLSGVLVKFIDCNRDEETDVYTDNNGYFSVYLDSGRYLMTVEKAGYTAISGYVEGAKNVLSYKFYLFNINWLRAIQSFMDNTNAQIQQLFNLYSQINENMTVMFNLYEQLKGMLEENLTVIYNVLNQLLTSQQMMLNMINTIQTQIQILSAGYQELKDNYNYLKQQIDIINSRIDEMKTETAELIENLKIELETEIENLKIELEAEIENLINEIENMKQRMNAIERAISNLENNMASIQNSINMLEARLFIIEQMLKVPYGFPTYTVKVKLVDENFNDINNEIVWLLMANGRILENKTSPAVFENVIADRTVVRYKDLRYEFILNNNANLLIMVKDNVAQVMTMVRINVNLVDNYAIVIIDGKDTYVITDNQLTLFLPAGEHTIEVRSGSYKGEAKITATHEPVEQYIELQKTELPISAKLLLAGLVLIFMMLIAVALSRRKVRYYRW